MIRTLLAVVMVAASACSTSASPIEIGAVYPTGGGQGVGGIEEYRGVELAVDLANRQGGVLGRPVVLRLAPTDAGEGAPEAVREVVDRGASIVLGSYGSTISRPAAAEATRQGVVFWETGAVGELGEGAGPMVFRVAPMGASLGKTAVEFVQEQLLPLTDHRGDVRYAVTYVDDVYGRAVGLGALAAIEEAGLRLAGAFPYDLQEVDYGELATQIERAGTDVLVVAAYLDDGVGLRRALVQQEVPLVASIGTSSSYCMREFGKLLGDDAVGLFASDKPSGEAFDPSRLAPEAEAALVWARDEYRARYDDQLTAPALAGFAGAWALLEHVIPAAGSVEPEDVARAARALRLPPGALPNGSGLDFPGLDHDEPSANLGATSVIWEWVRTETREIVWPPEMADHPIVPIRL